MASAITVILFKGPYGHIFPNLQATLLAILVTRMQVELWKSDREIIGFNTPSNAFSSIVFASPPSQTPLSFSIDP
ncbi:hypothetical protein SERLA73DRAFT_172678 [Serpula lacrymans var. lacrymans S7.3]|uniref:Uncharacterized protein n=2 Tax=Serpula lacrymans var. lacrymans TaxID=341189 RepID=F8QG77_SERL3|nr:uncharacterized protein SERLADRAFT_453416 [Serpula lacrymans var. lacrymans S7.9]EGN92692.1 hypothetical protein SERLA73DRAFT_172678 [Serpula lacrymans var. lacrymans S7.3]EGO19444.1 hypothetical protein SERLADRAFT_453416 [Serpula lacrymans var. lacrymans S7.9]